MKRKPVILRAAAARDVDDALSHYLRESGNKLASGFIDSIEAALEQVATRPASGSTRYAVELDLPELRFQSLKRFPFLIFYVEGEMVVDVWRVLHASRDIPAWLPTDK